MRISLFLLLTKVEGFTRISALRWWILDRRMSASPCLNQFSTTLCHAFAMQLDALKFRFLGTLYNTLPQIIFYAKSFDVFGVTRLYAEVTQKCSGFINVHVHCYSLSRRHFPLCHAIFRLCRFSSGHHN